MGKHQVKGHVRKDGSVVKPHQRSGQGKAPTSASDRARDAARNASLRGSHDHADDEQDSAKEADREAQKFITGLLVEHLVGRDVSPDFTQADPEEIAWGLNKARVQRVVDACGDRNYLPMDQMFDARDRCVSLLIDRQIAGEGLDSYEPDSARLAGFVCEHWDDVWKPAANDLQALYANGMYRLKWAVLDTLAKNGHAAIDERSNGIVDLHDPEAARSLISEAVGADLDESLKEPITFEPDRTNEITRDLADRICYDRDADKFEKLARQVYERWGPEASEEYDYDWFMRANSDWMREDGKVSLDGLGLTEFDEGKHSDAAQRFALQVPEQVYSRVALRVREIADEEKGAGFPTRVGA